MKSMKEALNEFVAGMKQAFDVQGRSSPREYWSFIFVAFVFATIAAAIDDISGLKRGSSDVGAVSMIYAAIITAPIFSATVRRLHDAGKPGSLLLMSLVPFVGIVYLAIVLTYDSRKTDEPPISYAQLILQSVPSISFAVYYVQSICEWKLNKELPCSRFEQLNFNVYVANGLMEEHPLEPFHDLLAVSGIDQREVTRLQEMIDSFKGLGSFRFAQKLQEVLRIILDLKSRNSDLSFGELYDLVEGGDESVTLLREFVDNFLGERGLQDEMLREIHSIIGQHAQEFMIKGIIVKVNDKVAGIRFLSGKDKENSESSMTLMFDEENNSDDGEE